MAESVTPQSLKVLRLLRNVGVIRGFELQRRAAMEPPELIDALTPLVAQNLVAASGTLDVDSLARTQFAPLPSSRYIADYMLKNS
jgi:hypothetical protein